jgi:asparagine synthetase B (glutamine-hydrolysing)
MVQPGAWRGLRTPTPTPLEIATGVLHGLLPVDGGEAPAAPKAAAAPVAALERALRPYLSRSPCVVAFSGGRDSAALLSMATALARREGLPEPVPVTLEFASESTREREWQERLLSALRIADWVRIPLDAELDLVGPIATAGLAQHGLLYPANVHTIVPLATRAGGGSVLTGYGGDDVFGNWPWQDLAAVLGGRRRWRARDLRRVVHALAPQPIRSEVLLRRQPLLLPWLRPEVRREAGLALAHELSAEPRTWAARMAWTARRRAWRATVESMRLLADDHGAEVGCPFLDPGFLRALARAGGRWGWGGRTDTMRAVFSGLVPDEILARRSKAEFSEAFFARHTRRFAVDWDGRIGVASELLDNDTLRRVWCMRQPHFLSAMALQAAWLASRAGPDELGDQSRRDVRICEASISRSREPR